MRVAATFLGLDLFSVEVSTDVVDDDCSRDLSGGTLATDRIEAGSTDCFMGFTAGMEDE